MSVKHVVMMAAGGVGPTVGVALFAGLGNQWEMAELRVVMLVGGALSVIPIMLLFFLSDDHSLGVKVGTLGLTPSKRLTLTPKSR